MVVVHCGKNSSTLSFFATVPWQESCRRVYATGVHVLEGIVKVIPVNIIHVTCDLAKRAMQLRTRRLGMFWHSVGPGYKFNYKFVGMEDLCSIKDINIGFLDENLSRIDIRNEKTTVNMTIREKSAMLAKTPHN